MKFYSVVIQLRDRGRDPVEYYFAGLEISNGVIIHLRMTPARNEAVRGPKEWADAQISMLDSLKISAALSVPWSY